MCEICGYRKCPAACPGNDDAMVECACCGEEVYLFEVDEVLGDNTYICAYCVAEKEPDVLDAVREEHKLTILQIIRRWAGV